MRIDLEVLNSFDLIITTSMMQSDESVSVSVSMSVSVSSQCQGAVFDMRYGRRDRQTNSGSRIARSASYPQS